MATKGPVRNDLLKMGSHPKGELLSPQPFLEIRGIRAAHGPIVSFSGSPAGGPAAHPVAAILPGFI
jgi:hypothetical protein